MTLHVAVVGAGPAGFYTAEALLDRRDDIAIDIIERLPTPYGLIRAGVAPDHQHTKQVSRRFEETALHEKVNFFGNVTIGDDVTVPELLDMYDAVVLAVGMARDRALGIPGEQLEGVYGASLFVNWYNGHPDFRDLNPQIAGRSAVVIGNGNVALDVARVLVKSRTEMRTSDLPDYAVDAIEYSGITDVYIVGRRGPGEAKFTPAELRELGELETASVVIDPEVLPPEEPRVKGGGAPGGDKDRRAVAKNIGILRGFAATMNAEGERGKAAREKPRRVHFVFYAAPVEILGDDGVEGVRFEHMELDDGRLIATGERFVIPCNLVVAAIGYRGDPLPDVRSDPYSGIIPSDAGRVDPGLYVVGWAKRGPTGIIGSNRVDGVHCAEQICADFPERRATTSEVDYQPTEKPGREALEELLWQRQIRAFTFEDWQTIDRKETMAADGAAPRRKLTSLAEMVQAVAGIDREDHATPEPRAANAK